MNSNDELRDAVETVSREMAILAGRATAGGGEDLDGSDGALVFSLPRLELRSSSRGWRSLCFLADGSRREVASGRADSLMAAQAAAIEQAWSILGEGCFPAMPHPR